MTLESLYDLDCEKDIQELTGLTSMEVSEWIDDVTVDARVNGVFLHADDDRQECCQIIAEEIMDDARHLLLPKYVKKFEHEIKEHEDFIKESEAKRIKELKEWLNR
jgi:hypothetical protein